MRADLLDPATIAALGRIEVTARWIVDGFLSGLHRSPRKGFSVEFAEHRPYQAGDEPRHVDWKLAARADRWAVKQYEEETNLRATVVLDVSRSMAWTGAPTRLTKLAYAERLAAAIALTEKEQRDRCREAFRVCGLGEPRRRARPRHRAADIQHDCRARTAGR